MTHKNTSITPPLQPISPAKPISIGASIALLLISFFVWGVEPDPAWGRFWIVRPLIITPLAGAMGGAFYAFMDYQRSRGFNRTLAVLMSLVVFLVGLWLGVVLGLDGTLWD